MKKNNFTEFVQSARFLSGSPNEPEKHFSFAGKRPWNWKVANASEFFSAIEIRENRQKNSVSLLEEKYVSKFRMLHNEIFSLGCGDSIVVANRGNLELSELLSNSERVRSVINALSLITENQNALAAQNLSEQPYAHLSIALLMGLLAPNVEFPFLTVLVDAYLNGLLPFGVFGGSLDFNYSGPDILLCLDPAHLQEE